MYATIRQIRTDSMARQLTFELKRRTYRVSPVKIDRRKLYGWTQIDATDDAGEPCEVVSTDETGRLILPRGGTAVGLLTPRGEWVERSELKTVAADGKPARLLPSSFSAPIELRRKVTQEQFFDHNITDFYALPDAADEFLHAVGDAVYTFEYCYSEGCEGNPAFILAAGDGLFLLVGERLRFEAVGYDEPEFIDESADGDDAVDFAMFD